jgi:putative intracellular protease/amidase
MQIAFLLYQGFTPLDAVGPYQVLAAMPGAAPVFVAEEAGHVHTDSGCSIVAGQSLAETNPSEGCGRPRKPDVVHPDDAAPASP